MPTCPGSVTQGDPTGHPAVLTPRAVTSPSTGRGGGPRGPSRLRPDGVRRSHTRVTPSEVHPARPPSVFPTEPCVGPSSPSLCGARTFPDENTSGSVPHAPFISDTQKHRPPHTAVNADFTRLDTALKPPPKRTLSSARASSSPSRPQGPRPCPSGHTGRRRAGPNVPLSALLVQGAEPQPSVNSEQEMSVRG